MRSGLSPRLVAMAGNAVLTMVVSSVCMKKPIATSHRRIGRGLSLFMRREPRGRNQKKERAPEKKPPGGDFLIVAERGSGREARTATTGGGRAGVLDDELRALQVFLVVDLGTDQVLVAHRVDQQRDPILGHGGVI